MHASILAKAQNPVGETEFSRVPILSSEFGKRVRERCSQPYAFRRSDSMC